MEITYLGHSCFRIRGRESTIITDPFSPKYGYSMGRPTAGIVTLSSDDGADRDDHTHVDGVAGDPRVVNGPGEYEIANVFITGFRTHSSNGAGAGATDLHLNTIYVLDLDDLRVCHLGDLADTLTADQIESIGTVNVLMIPVGGKGTIGAKRATEVVSQLEPSIIVPMHYRIEGTRSDELESVDRFINEMGAKTLTPEPKLVLNARSSLPTDIQVTVMEPKRG